MKDKVFRNPEIRRFFIQAVILASILTILALFYFSHMIIGYNKTLINKNLSIIGEMSKKHPELGEEIVKAFTKDYKNEDIQSGLRAAAQYGYDSRLPISIQPVENQFYKRTLAAVIVFGLAALMAVLSLIYLFFKFFYKRINEAAAAAEKIVDGDFDITLKEESEGDLAKLGHQFNQMAKQLKLSLEQLKNEKIFLKNIISDISHQLKTPLASIKIYNEILLSGSARKEEDREKFLSETSGQIERMEWLIQNLLVMARLEAGAIEFKMEYRPLLPTVEASVEGLRTKWEEKQQRVEVVCDTAGMMFKHDEGWLGEAISNVIKNSIEHTGTRGNIRIELNETAVMARIIIKDNGEGIPREDLPYIFQRFYKGRQSSKRTGVGIGLAFAKAVIESHGGLITAASDINQGTTFTITLPKI